MRVVGPESRTTSGASRGATRGIRAIRNKIDLLRQQSFDDALRSRLIKKPSAMKRVKKPAEEGAENLEG